MIIKWVLQKCKTH